MSDRERLGRAFGSLGVAAGVFGMAFLPLLERPVGGSLPALLVLAALVGGFALALAPRRLLEAIPSVVMAGSVLTNQTAFALVTGDADSPFLPGYTVIIAAVAASATIRLTVGAVIFAAVGLLIVGLADAVPERADFVRVVVDAVVLMAMGTLVSRLAWRRRIDVAKAAARLDKLRATALHHRLASETDPLTGVGNRRAFESALLARSHSGRPNEIALLMADVDGLKSVNDRLGHEAGDAMLRAIAEALVARLRPDDRLFRIGGDEFAAILDRRSAEGTARRFGATLSIEVDGIGPVSASIGVAVAPDGASPRTVLRLADEEMYARKDRAQRRREVPSDAA